MSSAWAGNGRSDQYAKHPKFAYFKAHRATKIPKPYQHTKTGQKSIRTA